MKSFKKLSASQKRVAIAKDILAQIRAKKYIATSGNYALPVDTRKMITLDQEHLTGVNQVVCKVCGIGSAILSIIRLRNTFNAYLYFNSGEAFKVAKAHFSSKQICQIEAAFERTEAPGLLPRTGLVPGNYVNELKFGLKYKNETNRLIAIWQNVIKNNGTFKP